MSFFKPRRKKSGQLRVREIRFVGEQDGPPERILKEKFIEFFRRDGSISRAFLARVDFGEGTNAGVALALRSEFGPDKLMVEQVTAIFGHVFNTGEHLDIIFLTTDQEAQVASACPAFFQRALIRSDDLADRC